MPTEKVPRARSVAAMLTYDDTAPAIEARAIVKVFGEGDTEVRALEGVDTFSRAARRAGNE